jgi:hypothetical protein
LYCKYTDFTVPKLATVDNIGIKPLRSVKVTAAKYLLICAGKKATRAQATKRTNIQIKFVIKDLSAESI